MLEMEEAIRNHRAMVLLPNDRHRIRVRRGSIFDDTLKGGINDNKHIHVRFLGKPSKLFVLKSYWRASYGSGRPQERVLYDFDEHHFKQQFTSGRTTKL